MNDDLTLLLEFARNHSEPAFAALVDRHIHIVYSVALRQVRDPLLAEEITQAVFIILARKAGSIGGNIVLPGWLCRTARYVGREALRNQHRRQQREQEAYMQTALDHGGDAAPQPSEAAWTQIAPLLDDALEQLGRKDHDALVLRFFENKNFAEVGAALGATENAAKMRVSRALGKLRRFFSQHGICCTQDILAREISANSVQAVPAALAKTVVTVAVAKGMASVSVATLTLVKGALRFMAWTKARTAIIVGVSVFLAIGTATVAINQISRHKRVKETQGFYTFHYSNVDSEQVLQVYGALTGIKLKIGPHPWAGINMATSRPLTKKEAIKLLQDTLKEQSGLVITPLNDKQAIVKYDPSVRTGPAKPQIQ